MVSPFIFGYMNTLYFDGACAPINPGGHMGMGVVIKDENGNTIHTMRRQIMAEDFPGQTSNNVAEYMALQMGLEWCIKSNIRELYVKGDSQLAIKQMRGEFKIKSGAYKEKALETKELIKDFDTITFELIKRELNQEADELSGIYLEGNKVTFYYTQNLKTHKQKKEKAPQQKNKNTTTQQTKTPKVKFPKLTGKDSTNPQKVAEYQKILSNMMEEIKPKRHYELTPEERKVKNSILREGHLRRESKTQRDLFGLSSNNAKKKKSPPKGGWV
jgi:ribonuclease HI